MKADSTDNDDNKIKKDTTPKIDIPIKITELPICGVVMPIASMGNEYTENHWKDVFNIIKEAARIAGYTAQLVSHSDSVGVIHNDIVQNLYQNGIVVCDVSGKNPNVMFELGMRLTFDKPTVIIKDDFTNYSFDISSIRHEEYPRDLRYNLVQDFKEKLAKRIRETVTAYKDDNYTTFLKHFKNLQIKAPQLETKEVSINEIILTKLDNIRERISRLENRNLLQNDLNKMFDDKRYIDRITLKLNGGGTLGMSVTESLREYYRSFSLEKVEDLFTYDQSERFTFFTSYLRENISSWENMSEDSLGILCARFYEIEKDIISNVIREKKETA